VPRLARLKGINTTYHIIMRGNEKKKIFLDDRDKYRFLEIIAKMRVKYNYKLEAYCLMDNHVHLLINDNGNDISKIMKSINISYVYYFNNTYDRVGHLFQGRFISEIVADDKYLLAVSAYIHNNPVRAGIVKRPEDFYWSSMREYMSQEPDRKIIYCYRILGICSPSYPEAISTYYQSVRNMEKNYRIFMDIEEDEIQLRRQEGDYIESFEEGRIRINNELVKRGLTMKGIRTDKPLRKEMMEMLRKNSVLSLKEIGELCGGYAESTVSIILKRENHK